MKGASLGVTKLDPYVVNYTFSFMRVDSYSSLIIVPVRISIQVHGPKGKFNITTEKVASDPRRVQISYHPTDVGVYVIEVTWSEAPVPGSPFSINISQSSPRHTRQT